MQFQQYCFAGIAVLSKAVQADYKVTANLKMSCLTVKFQNVQTAQKR